MYDAITFGSSTIDVFLETGDKLFGKHKNGKISVPFGSKIIVENIQFHAGGGGTNSAIALSRMGLKTAYIGNVSSSEQADFILSRLKKDKVDTSLVVKKGAMCGYSAILDAKGHDRTILAHKGSNNMIRWHDINIPKIKTRWIYMTSMMGESLKTAKKLAVYAKQKGIKLMFNPSSYLVNKGTGFIKEILSYTDVLVYNKEEAELLLGKRSMTELLEKSRRLGPNVVIITDGPKGAYASDGKEKYFIKANKVKVLETTGAGDSFGAGFLAGYIKSKGDVVKALCVAQANSESVITHYGAHNKLLNWKEANSKTRLRNVHKYK